MMSKRFGDEDPDTFTPIPALPPAMTWTRMAPKEVGYYWFKVPRSEAELYTVFETSAGGLAIENSGEVYGVEMFDGDWAGPMEPPQ